MKFYITDVFGKSPYSGNQLATFTQCAELSDAEMQKIAREINFSETTFVLTDNPNASEFKVRIFTPNEEIDFAGHPTLGTAYVIHKHIIQKPTKMVSLNLRVGQISVFLPTGGIEDDNRLWMQQLEPQFGEIFDRSAIAPILGIQESEIHSDWPIRTVSTGLPHIVVPLMSRHVLKKIRISEKKYSEFTSNSWAKSFAVFSTESHEPEQSISVRVFAGYYGVPEDPATGSGNGCIAGYLVKERMLGTSSIDLKSGQGYEMGRPSELSLFAESNDSGICIRIGGNVFSIACGEWPLHQS